MIRAVLLDRGDTLMRAGSDDEPAGFHPDVGRLLAGLRARGLRIGVVSNTDTPRRFFDPDLDVDAVVLSCEVGKRKPHPAIFERALDALGVAAADAVFVGDRLYEDVRGAGELGMTTVQALWFRADEHPEGGEPDFQAFTQMDVLNVVERLAAAA